MKSARFLSIVFLAALLLLTPACGDDYQIDPAPIHQVDVRFAESFPEQVLVYIQGGLRDGCTAFDDARVERNETGVTITITTRRPKDAVCPAIYGYFEHNVNLGSDFVRGRTYTLNVNDYTTTFTYPR